MIELGTKLTKAAFDKVGSEASGKKSLKSSSENMFSSVLEKTQNKEVSEVIKSISKEMDLRPIKDVTAIPTQSLENVKVNGEGTPSGATQKVADILGEVNDGQVKLQRLVDLVTNGTKLSPQELIAVQAGVFSLVQELELVGKATQEATQGVRQTLNTNLG